MKKKIIRILIIAIITTLGLFAFWSKNYLTALWHFKSDNPERHRLAFFELDEISGSITINLFERLGYKLQKEVYKDYQSYKRAELIKRYSNTFIAYIDDRRTICIRSFDGKKIKRFKLDEGYSSEMMLRWSKDGQKLVVSDDTNSLYITDHLGENVTLLNNDEYFTMPDWAFSDRKIVLSSLVAVKVYSLDSGYIDKIYRAPVWQRSDTEMNYSPFYPIWLDDKNILVSIKNNMEVINSETRERKIIHTNKKANELAMNSFSTENFTFGMKALSYSGKLVAMEGGGIFNLEDKTVVYKGFDDFPTWAPDDKYIMSFHYSSVSINPGGIEISVVDDDERLHDIRIYMGPGRAPAWSPPLDNYDEIVAQMDDNVIDYNFDLEEPLFR